MCSRRFTDGGKRICKQGGSLLRHTLYMCALNAKETNGACKGLFDRACIKGKEQKIGHYSHSKLAFKTGVWCGKKREFVRQKLF